MPLLRKSPYIRQSAFTSSPGIMGVFDSGQKQLLEFLIGNSAALASGLTPIVRSDLSGSIIISPKGGQGLMFGGDNGDGYIGNSLFFQRGTATVSDTNTSVTVTLPKSIGDTNYRVLALPVSSTGTPAAGSNRILSISKTTSSFTLTVEVAPGTGNSVTFDWLVIRG